MYRKVIGCQKCGCDQVGVQEKAHNIMMIVPTGQKTFMGSPGVHRKVIGVTKYVGEVGGVPWLKAHKIMKIVPISLKTYIGSPEMHRKVNECQKCGSGRGRAMGKSQQ